MNDDLLEHLLREQHDCVAVWQLMRAGRTRAAARCRLPGAGLRPVRGADGIWTATRRQLSARQRWMAAALTAPGTYVAGRSASLLWEFGDRWPREGFVTVARRGTGGAQRYGGVVVSRTLNLPDACVTRHHGIPVLTAARTLVDVAGGLGDRQLRRAVLEALRLQVATSDGVGEELRRRRNAKGAGRVRDLLLAVEGLPLGRCRSNAEATALLRRRQAGRPDVAVNETVGRFEADLVDYDRMEITELDSRRFHLDPELDAEKNAEWRSLGFRVNRRSTDDAYDPLAGW